MSCSDWRDVVGYEGTYQVSRFGDVRRLRRDGTPKLPLRDRPAVRGGHLRTNLSLGGIQTTVQIHRVVLEAWVGPCPAGMQGCHNDGDPTNNAISNLRWDNREGNIQDAIKHGAYYTRRVRRSDGMVFNSIAEAAEYTGCHRSNIGSACSGRYKTAGGYGWSYC